MSLQAAQFYLYRPDKTDFIVLFQFNYLFNLRREKKTLEERSQFVFLYHFLVVLVGEVKHRLHGSELVENFVVSRHVGGQNTPEKIASLLKY